MSYTAHVDTFARDNLPPRGEWPELLFLLPELQYPERMNCATMLLDRSATAEVWQDLFIGRGPANATAASTVREERGPPRRDPTRTTGSLTDCRIPGHGFPRNELASREEAEHEHEQDAYGHADE